MFRILAAMCLLLMISACSDSAEVVVEADCSRIVGSVWHSVEELTGGELPGGGVGTEHWTVEFGEGDADWWHTDVVVTVSYRCHDGMLSAGEPWREIQPEMIDRGDRPALLRWHGDLYRRVDSFYDVP